MNSKTRLPGLTVGKLFESTISNVSEIRNHLDFKGDVDIGVTLNTTLEDKTGILLVPFKGNDTSHSTIQVKLATRIHLSEIEKTIKFTFQNELDRGAEGAEVKKLQRKLNQLLNLTLKVDGVYGENTANAVKAFKCLKGLTPDGRLDETAGKMLMET